MNDQLPTTVDEERRLDVAAPASTARPLPVTEFDKLADAIAAVMREIEPVEKGGKNTFQNYKFARMQDVLQELTPLMSKHGIVIMQSEVERGFMDKGGSIYATYDFTVMHKSGQVWPERQRQTGVSRTRDSKGGFDDKSLNKCHTAARKYFLMSLFQIPTSDDVDHQPRKTQHDQPRIEQPPAPKAGEIVRPENPVALPRGGGEWQDWTRAWLMMINGAPTIEIAEQWLALNKDTLDRLRSELETHHQFVVREYNKRLRKLSPSEAP